MSTKLAALHYWHAVSNIAYQQGGVLRYKPPTNAENGTDPDVNCLGVAVRDPIKGIAENWPNSSINCFQCWNNLCGYRPCAVRYLAQSDGEERRTLWLCKICDQGGARFARSAETNDSWKKGSSRAAHGSYRHTRLHSAACGPRWLLGGDQ